MSCNGCRVLRKGCSDTCILRPSLQWLETAEAQGHATLFVAKFFGRAGLMSFISAVPENQRPALFQSLLFEAVGRTVNPVNGVVGLLSSGNWHVCKAAVETVLRGGTLRPMSEFSDEGFMCTEMLKIQEPSFNSRVRAQKRRRMFEDPERIMQLSDLDLTLTPGFKGQRKGDSTDVKQRLESPSRFSEESVTTTCGMQPLDNEIKLLNLF